MTELLNHELVPEHQFSEIRYEERPVLGRDGETLAGIHQVWIWLDNERQLNSYTTEAVKELILAFRRASCDRGCVAVVFTAVGDRSFCTGGNTAEYASYYAGRPHEYLQYMRLFNDMVTNILICDKPVICRVNGMRIGGGPVTSRSQVTTPDSVRRGPFMARRPMAAPPTSCTFTSVLLAPLRAS